VGLALCQSSEGELERRPVERPRRSVEVGVEPQDVVVVERGPLRNLLALEFLGDACPRVLRPTDVSVVPLLRYVGRCHRTALRWAGAGRVSGAAPLRFGCETCCKTGGFTLRLKQKNWRWCSRRAAAGTTTTSTTRRAIRPRIRTLAARAATARASRTKPGSSRPIRATPPSGRGGCFATFMGRIPR